MELSLVNKKSSLTSHNMTLRFSRQQICSPKSKICSDIAHDHKHSSNLGLVPGWPGAFALSISNILESTLSPLQLSPFRKHQRMWSNSTRTTLKVTIFWFHISVLWTTSAHHLRHSSELHTQVASNVYSWMPDFPAGAHLVHFDPVFRICATIIDFISRPSDGRSNLR
jgi:hypothetical protein